MKSIERLDSKRKLWKILLLRAYKMPDKVAHIKG